MDRGVCRVLGLDPGSRNLGYAITDIDIRKAEKGIFLNNATYMESLLVDQIERRYQEAWYGRTERQRRLKSCGIFAQGLVETFDPDIVVIEDAYLNRRQPTSYRSLSEGIIYLVEAIRDFDDNIPIIITEAMRAKKAVGAKAKRGGDQKTIVKTAIRNNKEINVSREMLLTSEHAIDALALAHYGATSWWEENRFYYLGL